jgi:hypothetical protein
MRQNALDVFDILASVDQRGGEAVAQIVKVYLRRPALFGAGQKQYANPTVPVRWNVRLPNKRLSDTLALTEKCPALR